MYKSKKGAINLLAIALIAIAGFALFQMNDSGGDLFAGAIGDSSDEGQGDCSVEDVTVTYQLAQQANPTRIVDSTPDFAIVNGDSVSTSAPSTASVGDNIQVLFSNSTGYGAIEEVTLGCRGTKDVRATTNHVNTSALTTKIWNENGDVMTDSTGGATNATIGSGGSLAMDMKITGNSEEGHPAGLILVEYPTTKHAPSDIVTNLGGSKISCPSWYTVTATTQSTVCYSVPEIDGAKSLTGTLSVKAKSGQDPATGDSYSWTYMTPDVYYDDDTNSFEQGFEDEDGTDITVVKQKYDFGIL